MPLCLFWQRGSEPRTQRCSLSPSASSSERSVSTLKRSRINSFTNIWDAALVLFGLSLFVLAYLAYTSGSVPKLLGLLLAFAGFGYVLDPVIRVIVRGSSSDVSAITGMGEFVFALWLVFWGRRINMSGGESQVDSIRASR